MYISRVINWYFDLNLNALILRNDDISITYTSITQKEIARRTFLV